MNVGVQYMRLGEYSDALEYFGKAARVLEKFVSFFFCSSLFYCFEG